MELLRIQLCPKRSTRASLSTCLTLGTHIASELCVSLTVKHRLNPSSELFCAQHLARTSLWSAPDPRSSSGHAPWPLPDSELVFLLLLLSTHDNNFFGKRSFPKKRFVILPKAQVSLATGFGRSQMSPLWLTEACISLVWSRLPVSELRLKSWLSVCLLPHTGKHKEI